MAGYGFLYNRKFKNELLNLTMKCRLMQQKHFNKVPRYVGASYKISYEYQLSVEEI